MIKRLLKTDWLFTGIDAPIQEGMIAIDEHNIIADVGFDLEVDGLEPEYYKGALCPAFVNAHCHLELSHLKGKISEGKQLHNFIQEVQKERTASEDEIQAAILKADKQMLLNGTIAVGDISNGINTLQQKKKSKMHYHTFVELFAFDPEQAERSFNHGKAIREKFAKEGLPASIVPHSPYSVSEKLFTAIGDENEGPVCIHNQETEAENTLYQIKEGTLAEMLKGFGLPIEQFKASHQNSLPSYLPFLKSIKPLQLVHNTFTSKEDIQFAEEMHSALYWCFCPGANQYIERRLPNIPQFIEADVKCTLGTDSLASNYTLSILEEIKCIQKAYPSIGLETLIQWATINGAEFLGVETEIGSLEIGKKAYINAISQLKGLGLSQESVVKPVFA